MYNKVKFTWQACQNVAFLNNGQYPRTYFHFKSQKIRLKSQESMIYWYEGPFVIFIDDTFILT